MATRVIDDNKLNNIATAIQAKDGGGQMTVDEMAGRIDALFGNPLFSHSGNCYFSKIVFSNTVTELSSGCYLHCALLEEVVFTKSITSIGTSVFRGCTGLITIDLSAYDDPNNIPNLGNTNAFLGTPANKVLLVRNQAMLDAFKSATNWSTYASRFQIKN